MNSSVKFFAPRVSDLPLSGWPLGTLGLELELELDLSLDPQAARPTASATASKATIVLYHVLLVIPSLPVVVTLLRAPSPSRSPAAPVARAASPSAGARRKSHRP